MAYSMISSRRIPYDVDGTAVGYGTILADTWLNSSQVTALNDEIVVDVITLTDEYTFLFFPEKREIEAGLIQGVRGGVKGTFTLTSIQGSNDTSNGHDGTWETATFPSGLPLFDGWDSIAWRTQVKPISFSEPKKVLKLRIVNSTAGANARLFLIHLYGRKSAGETPDDILLCDVNGNELTALMDWGDRPEATEQIKSIKLKNVSTTKTANGVNLQLNHGDFGLSFNVSGSWTATLDIASIPPNGLSEPIYIKNTVGLPPQILGPKAGRLIVGVGSWT